MAFKDLEIPCYDDTRLLTYKDAAHRYYIQEKEADGKWGKKKPVKGVTTVKDGTLEKKGLMTWPMGMALGELFGFYNFKNEKGEQMTGFSKGKGTLWNIQGLALPTLKELTFEMALPFIKSASEAWQRKKKTGADVGSMVHKRIEDFLMVTDSGVSNAMPALITLEEYEKGQPWSRDDGQDITEEEAATKYEWMKQAPTEVEMANKALDQFVKWWTTALPKLIGAEQVVYSKDANYAGTFDAIIEIDGQRILADWKTSNASTSREAAAPQGVYYDFFVQMGGYAAAYLEMYPDEKIDDIMIVSVRKDGGFDTKLASELNLTVGDCIKWWRACYACFQYMNLSKMNLLKGGQDNGGL